MQLQPSNGHNFMYKDQVISRAGLGQPGCNIRTERLEAYARPTACHVKRRRTRTRTEGVRCSLQSPEGSQRCGFALQGFLIIEVASAQQKMLWSRGTAKPGGWFPGLWRLHTLTRSTRSIRRFLCTRATRKAAPKTCRCWKPARSTRVRLLESDLRSDRRHRSQARERAHPQCPEFEYIVTVTT